MSKTGRVEIENFARRELPSGYTQVEYIESSGTQYIDTGFMPNHNTRVVAKLKLVVGSSSVWGLGARISSSADKFCFVGSANGYYMSQYGTSQGGLSSRLNNFNAFVLDKNKNVTSIDGSVVLTDTVQTFTCPVNLTLFAVNNNGTINKGSAVFYYCQIYDNNSLVRDFVPCLNAEGTAGLYDLVDDIFYANAGSGTFITGDIYRCDGLIYDREQADVDQVAYLIGRWRDGSITDMEKAEWAESMKGAYNAGDLNRVGAAVNYVAELLTEWGYPYAPGMREDWKASELFYAADLAEYLAAVEGLRARLAAFTDTPETPDKISTWQQANDIERIIEDVHLLLQNMVAGLPYADIIYSGAYPF